MRLNEFCEIEPHVELIPEFDPKPSTNWYGIKALWYEGTEYMGKRTKVFAYIGYPEVKEGQTVPAVVLVHGGAGHAYGEWIKKWNNIGFAAIAMDTTGYFPTETCRGFVGIEGENLGEQMYTRELYGELAEEGYIGGPDNDGVNIPENCSKPMSEQWLYHGVVDTILAHNILRNDSRIDKDNIGIVGISWGAVLTSLAIGYDSRYAFAIPIYGSAYLDYKPSPGYINNLFCDPSVKKIWSAADRLKNVNFPVLWLCWCYDHAFTMFSNSLSYQATKEGGSSFCALHDWWHGHGCAWDVTVGYRFAEKILKKEVPLIKPLVEPKNFGEISFEIEIPKDFSDVEAKIYYLTRPVEYEDNQMTEKWKSQKADVCGTYVTGVVPEEAYCYFVEMKGNVNGESYISDTAIVKH